MNTLRMVSVFHISIVAVVAILLVLNVISGEAAKNAAIKAIMICAIIGGSAGLISLVRK